VRSRVSISAEKEADVEADLLKRGDVRRVRVGGIDAFGGVSLLAEMRLEEDVDEVVDVMDVFEDIDWRGGRGSLL